MGETRTVAPTHCRPTQDYLVPKIVRKYAAAMGRLGSSLCPVPVLQDVYDDQVYHTIDGHHRLSAARLTQKDVIAWVVNGPNDLIPYELFPGVSRKAIDNANRQIKRRYAVAAHFCPRDGQGNDIKSIDDLIDTNGILAA